MERPDSILQAALDRIQELVAERNELEAFVATYRKLKERSAKCGEPEAEPVALPTLTASNTAAIIDAAMTALAKHRGPMKLSDLHDAIVASGVTIGGKNAKNNLGAKLSADPRLVTHKDLGWWFASDLIPIRYQVSDERGSATEMAEPLQSNGAAVSPATHQPEF